MSYADTHLYRLGVNYRELPVNKPRCPVRNYARDGPGLRRTLRRRPELLAQPREGAPNRIRITRTRLKSARSSSIATTPPWITTTTPAGNLYRMFDEAHRERLARASPRAWPARKEVQTRQVVHFLKADKDYGQRWARSRNRRRSSVGGRPRLTRQPVASDQRRGRGLRLPIRAATPIRTATAWSGVFLNPYRDRQERCLSDLLLSEPRQHGAVSF